MKKLIPTVAGICLAFFIAGSAIAGQPSAKFAAAWTTKPGLKTAVIIEEATADKKMVDSNAGYTLATIKVPQDKELLVGVSAEIGLLTDTSVKGKNGGTARSIADAEAYVTVFAVPKEGGDSLKAAPGQIMLSKRVQDLGATLGGVIESCEVNCNEIVEYDPITGAVVSVDVVCDDIVIAEDCIVTDEEISLLQDTTAAHHFNFVLPNMNQGVYDIKAVFTTGARAEIDLCDLEEECVGTVSGSAKAVAVINKTMVTVQQVRAAKGSLHEIDIIEM